MATKAKPQSAKGEKKGGFMKKFLLFVSGLLVAGGSAAGVIFFFYQDGMPFQEEGTPPLVQADENPFKIRPENPEGMEFAHRDNTAYEAIENPESLVDDGVISPRLLTMIRARIIPIRKTVPCRRKPWPCWGTGNSLPVRRS